MRALLPLVVLSILGAPLAGAGEARPVEPTTLVGMDLRDDYFLAWTPVPGAQAYDVYRGPDPGNLTLLGTTHLTYFLDDKRPDGDLLYGVVVTGMPPRAHLWSEEESGSCVSMRMDLRWSVNVKDCLS